MAQIRGKTPKTKRNQSATKPLRQSALIRVNLTERHARPLD
jgi:hypothetical protein